MCHFSLRPAQLLNLPCLMSNFAYVRSAETDFQLPSPSLNCIPYATFVVNSIEEEEVVGMRGSIPPAWLAFKDVQKNRGKERI